MNKICHHEVYLAHKSYQNNLRGGVIDFIEYRCGFFDIYGFSLEEHQGLLDYSIKMLLLNKEKCQIQANNTDNQEEKDKQITIIGQCIELLQQSFRSDPPKSTYLNYKGRKRSLSEEQIQNLKDRVNTSKKKAKLTRKFGISWKILYQYLKTKI